MKEFLKLLWRILKIIFKISLAVGTLGIVAFFCYYAYLSLTLPSADEIRPKSSGVQSVVYGAEGKVLGEYLTTGADTLDFDDYPKMVVDALIATEDKRYWSHSGVDFRAYLRAIRGVLSRKSEGGGSTIEQQYIKAIFQHKRAGRWTSLHEKMSEAILAGRLIEKYESRYKKQREAKERIVALYLNSFEFPHGARGFRNFSRVYFGKKMSELTPREIAAGVAMFKSPTMYNPRRDNDVVKQRQDVVLQLMRQENTITESQYNSAKKGDLDLSHFQEPSRGGYAAQFMSVLERTINDLNLGVDLRNDGLKIFTTINTDMQKIAYQTATAQLGKNRRDLSTAQLAFVAIENGTGHVKAWYGGDSYLDHVTRIERQTGSSFKPFVYATAIQQAKLSPCDLIEDSPVSIMKGEGDFNNMKPYTPSNSHEFSGETVTHAEALRQSLNSGALFALKQLGSLDEVNAILEKMSMPLRKDLLHSPSVVLGVNEYSPLQMAGAYSMFANGGTYIEPVFLLKIVDRNGDIIYEAKERETATVLDPATAYIMQLMLHNDVKDAPGISSLKSYCCGKTGTSQNQADAWFCGFTPQISIAVWSGGENQKQHFSSLATGQGAVAARPVFTNFIASLEKLGNGVYDPTKLFNPAPTGVNLGCLIAVPRDTLLEQNTQSPDGEDIDDVLEDL